MVKPSTIVGIAVVGVAGLLAYFLFTKEGGASFPAKQDLSSPLNLGGQSSGGAFASGGSSITEVFSYAPKVTQNINQTLDYKVNYSTTKVETKFGILNL